MKEYLELGQIVNTHGLGGLIKVTPWTDGLGDILSFDRVYVGKAKKEYEIKNAQIHKNSVLLELTGVESIESAQKLKDEIIYMSKDRMPPLCEDCFYLADLIGLCACLPGGKILGVVKDVFQTGANEVLEITRDDGKECLVPFIKSCVERVDIEGGTIDITPLEGLFQDEV